jgi:2,4-dienoyl-CoA reductase-like NADH-dependent reductase (Old Yellow Enzyme family)
MIEKMADALKARTEQMASRPEANQFGETMKFFLPDESGAMIDPAAEVWACLKIPIITPSIDRPDQAEEALRGERTDMIGMARGFLVDPNWVNKVA